MALIPPFFLDCVVAIGFPKTGSGPQWAASGFLYAEFKSEDDQGKHYRMYLVTNRHVFDGKSLAMLRFNPEAAEPAREYPLPLEDAQGVKQWFTHSDPAVDVAVTPINAKKLRADGIRIGAFRS